MTPAIHRSPRRVGPNGLAAVMIGAILLTVPPSDAQQGEQWVAFADQFNHRVARRGARRQRRDLLERDRL